MSNGKNLYASTDDFIKSCESDIPTLPPDELLITLALKEKLEQALSAQPELFLVKARNGHMCPSGTLRKPSLAMNRKYFLEQATTQLTYRVFSGVNLDACWLCTSIDAEKSRHNVRLPKQGYNEYKDPIEAVSKVSVALDLTCYWGDEFSNVDVSFDMYCYYWDSICYVADGVNLVGGITLSGTLNLYRDGACLKSESFEKNNNGDNYLISFKTTYKDLNAGAYEVRLKCNKRGGFRRRKDGTGGPTGRDEIDVPEQSVTFQLP